MNYLKLHFSRGYVQILPCTISCINDPLLLLGIYASNYSDFLSISLYTNMMASIKEMGAHWLSRRVLVSRPRGRGFEPHRRHCVVVLEQDTFVLA